MHGKKKWRKCVLFMMLALMAGAGTSGTDIPVPGTAATYAASAEGTGIGAADGSAEKEAVSGSAGEQERTPATDKAGKESASGGQEADLQEQAEKGGAGEDAADTAGTASAAGAADSGKDGSGRAEETEIQEPYIYDYAEVISEEFETEFNQKVSEAGGHLKVLVVDGFSRSKYQYENYYNDKNGIDKSVMVVYDIHSNANPHVYAGARGKMSLNKIGYETLAWVQNCYSPGGGYITAGNAEANCRELLKAHLKICRKYKNVKQTETKPVKRKTFNERLGEFKAFVRNNIYRAGMISVTAFLTSTIFLVMIDIVSKAGPVRKPLKTVKTLSLIFMVFAAAGIAHMNGWQLPEGGFAAADDVTKLVFILSLTHVGALFLLTTACDIIAVFTYEYDPADILRLLTAKFNVYALAGEAGFAVYTAGLGMYQKYIAMTGLIMISAWVIAGGIQEKQADGPERTEPDPAGEKKADGKERTEAADGKKTEDWNKDRHAKKGAKAVYGLIPLYTEKNDLSFGKPKRGGYVFFRNIKTLSSLEVRYHQLAKIYHPDGQPSQDETENETFSKINREYKKLKKKFGGT